MSSTFLKNAFEARLEWILGAFYFDEEGDDGTGPNFVFVGFNPTNPFFSGGSFTNTSYSLFGQGTYALTEELSVTAGVRYTWDEREMTLTANNAFGCRIVDETGAQIDPCRRSVDESFSEPTWTLSELGGFYSLTDAEYDEFETDISGDLSGNEVPLNPEHTGSLRGRVYLPLAAGSGEAFLQAVWYAQSDIFYGETTVEAATVDSYDLLNLRAQWNDVLCSSLDAVLFVNDATDEEYPRGLFNLYEWVGVTLAIPAEPRLWGVESTYRFGDG